MIVLVSAVSSPSTAAAQQAAPSTAGPTFVGPPTPAASQSVTLAEARRLAAARRAPAQSARIATAVSARVDADRILRDNPVLSAAAGPRLGPAATSLDAEVGIEQPILLGGGRTSRMAIADAGTQRASAEVDDARRSTDRDVGAVFVDAVWADERVRLAEANVQAATSVEAVMLRRVAGGDATELERIAASSALARATSELIALCGAAAAARTRLRATCGLPRDATVAPVGDLPSIAASVERSSIPGEKLPELRVLRADQAAAAAELELGPAEAWPVLGVGARYSREDEAAHIIQGTLSLTLPFFDRGAGRRAEAGARMHQAEVELAIATATVEGEQVALAEALARAIEAAAVLDAASAANADKALAIARTRLAAGEDRLVDVLLLQGEMQSLRVERLDRWREAAHVALDLEYARGGRPAR